jgi:iron complex outermembrane receptor protein
LAVEDYLSRAKGGQGSPNFGRAAPTADDIAFFSGSGLTPVGAPTVVSDGFKNLQPQILAGVDLSLTWRKITAALGSFAASIDATRLDRFSQSPSSELQALYEARATGIINISTPLDSPGNQLQVLGNPKWKSTATLTWAGAHLQVGSSLMYTGSTLDTNFLSNSGVPWHVASLATVNLYVQYGLSLGSTSDQFRIKVGARNLFDHNPPLESDGYNGALYSPYGRYVYFNMELSL